MLLWGGKDGEWQGIKKQHIGYRVHCLGDEWTKMSEKSLLTKSPYNQTAPVPPKNYWNKKIINSAALNIVIHVFCIFTCCSRINNNE